MTKPTATAKKSKPAKPTKSSSASPLPRHALDTLYTTLLRRRRAHPDSSYTAKLYEKGRAHIAKKTGEEAVEVVIASLAEDRRALIAESGDLLYHLMVLWADAGVKPKDVWRELEKRFGTSGIDEKKSRPL